MIEKEIRYKFLHDMKSEKGNVKWKIGEWKRVKRKLVLGESGLHASCYIQDALGWMQGNTLAEVEVRGDHLGYLDMECWQEMRVIKMWSWDIRCSVKLTVIAARTVLNYFENDDRLRKAIEIAEEWLKKYQFDVDYCTALSWDLSPPPADSLAAEAANCATSGRIAQVSDKAKFETLLGLYIKKLVELGYDDEITRAQAIMLAAIQVSTAQATKGEIHTKMMEWLNERRLLES